jgi:hypothetical protein
LSISRISGESKKRLWKTIQIIIVLFLVFGMSLMTVLGMKLF